MKEDKELFKSFDTPSKAEWQKNANAEVGNGKSINTLRWTSEDNLTFAPISNDEDIQGLRYLDSFGIRTDGPDANNRLWLNMPEVLIRDEKKANAEALNHLTCEADGILFSTENSSISFNLLFEKIEWEHCNVSFTAQSDFPLHEMWKYIQLRNFDLEKIKGTLFWKDFNSIPEEIKRSSSLKLFGLHIESSTPVNEIVQALVAGTRVIQNQLNRGSGLQETLSNIAFSVPIGTQLLIEVSKLKALRNLWYQVSQAYNASGFKHADLHIHGRSEPWTNEKFQPHGNMLKGTIASIAGVTGGCNSITVCPEDPSNIVMSRIARNTSFILSEESHLGKVRDPLAGAYSLEVMTDTIMKAAWDKFSREV